MNLCLPRTICAKNTNKHSYYPFSIIPLPINLPVCSKKSISIIVCTFFGHLNNIFTGVFFFSSGNGVVLRWKSNPGVLPWEVDTGMCCFCEIWPEIMLLEQLLRDQLLQEHIGWIIWIDILSSTCSRSIFCWMQLLQEHCAFKYAPPYSNWVYNEHICYIDIVHSIMLLEH